MIMGNEMDRNQILAWAESLVEGSAEHLRAGHAITLGWIDLLAFSKACIATAPAPSAPVGYKLVPIEPTEAMRDAAEKSVPQVFSMGDEYRAMVAAAPAAPAPSDEKMVPVEAVKELCRDYSSRTGSVYIKDVEGALDGLAEQYAMPAQTAPTERGQWVEDVMTAVFDYASEYALGNAAAAEIARAQLRTMLGAAPKS
jgi:hypothetical protein